MNIAICEDNKAHTEILHDMIVRWAKQESISVEIECYESAEQFLVCMEQNRICDIIFIDIKMKKINGLELAKLIRKEDRAIIMIFTTGIKELALKGYEVSAFRYLIKPLKEREVAKILSKAREELERTKRDVIIVSDHGELRRIYKNEIYYLKADDHYISLYTNKEVIHFKGKLKDLEAQFESPQYCKCHRSYLINLHYVDRIAKDYIEMENGDILSLSKARWEEVNEKYLKYYMKK